MKRGGTSEVLCVRQSAMVEEQKQVEQANMNLSTWDKVFQFDPDLASSLDQCSDVFMDIGSHTGTHIRKLFEPEKYPGSPYLQVFDTAFGSPEHRKGPSRKTGICAFGFEANPQHAAKLQQIE